MNFEGRGNVIEMDQDPTMKVYTRRRPKGNIVNSAAKAGPYMPGQENDQGAGLEEGWGHERGIGKLSYVLFYGVH